MIKQTILDAIQYLMLFLLNHRQYKMKLGIAKIINTIART